MPAMNRCPFLLPPFRRFAPVFVAFLALMAAPLLAAPPELRHAEDALAAGNYQDAFRLYERLLLGEGAALTDEQAAQALDNALWCLPKIKRTDEFDGFAEKAVERHGGNWRLLWKAAANYLKAPHFGYMIAGKFARGPHRGGGHPLDCFERDRTRALQLMDRALKAGAREPDREARAAFCLDVADALLGGRQGREAWRLQERTDLSTLPDYEPQDRVFTTYGARAARGAPVDEEGRPVFHRLPRSWEAAATDGERWRYMFESAAELDATRRDEIRLSFADFLREQFGVQTLRQYAWWQRIVGAPGDARDGIVQLHTLSAEETIARLASGVRRFDLPDEFNYIKIYAALAQGADSDIRVDALKDLATVYENRRQYPMASNCWQNVLHVLKQGGAQPADRAYRDANWRLRQITSNWGEFETAKTQPAGSPGILLYRFRNGQRAGFNARRVKLDLLIADAKRHIKSHPPKLSHDEINLSNLGYRLVRRNEERYLETQSDAWVLGLEPREGHLDKRIRVQTPLTGAGAYLVTSTMDRGNISRIVLWLSDTTIVKKPLASGGSLLFVADTRTGEPVANAKIEGFGYRQVRAGRNKFRVEDRAFELTTDADGMAIASAEQMPNGWQWLITARTASGRFAFLGWTFAWPKRGEEPWYRQAKTYFITDRPVYRPGHTVHFKVWVRRAAYDLDDTSAFSGQDFRIEVRDPQNKEALSRTYTADKWGGIAGDLALPADAALGDWSIRVPSDGNSVGVSGVSRFRVEEYRKPEFEVTVDAPEEPVALGETIRATVRARYYFGEPVAKGRIAYKVTRTPHVDTWYPERPWDWLYGRGYWWRATERSGDTGAMGGGWWMPMPAQPPEMVAEGEMELKPDGTCAIPIDTALAKAVHGDTDHLYRIVAEVTDPSRRTIVGEGKVLAAREAWRVTVTMDRGYARASEKIAARIAARTAHGKPVSVDLRVTLARLADADASVPVENWKVRTDVKGNATVDMTAAQAGRYRLAASGMDAQGRTAKGEHAFTVVGDGPGGSFRYDGLTVQTDRPEYRPGQRAEMLVGAKRAGATVLFFTRPESGLYDKPRVLRLKDGHATTDIDVARGDMPNFFVEALCVSDGEVHVETREVFVPPESRVLNVEATPSRQSYNPGEQSTLELRVTDAEGRPFHGSAVLAVYDRALEYISDGSNVPDIRKFFWQWGRRHTARTDHTLSRTTTAEYRRGEKQMEDLGAFGDTVAEDFRAVAKGGTDSGAGGLAARGAMAAPAEASLFFAVGGQAAAVAEPTVVVRKNFADTAYWNAAVTTDADGHARVSFKMPDDLTGWQVRAWAVGDGTRVGEATAEIQTKKDLLVRLQTPRFLVEGDEALLSANVHNYLDREVRVEATLSVEGRAVDLRDRATRKIDLAPGDQMRVDWEVRADEQGEATVRLSAVSDLRADAMERKLPVLVHGIEQQSALCGMMRPDQSRERATLFVPGRIREELTSLEIRYSPSLALAAVDALPYLAGYPHGCTEQTLNRFLPTAITHRTLTEMGFDLTAARKRLVNLNPQELGDPAKRVAQWQRGDANPVFDDTEVERMTREGFEALGDMQLGDGGWGWFSGYGERSDAHTTAWVVRGLLVARDAGIGVPEKMLNAGIGWLEAYRTREFARLSSDDPMETKRRADEIDALVNYVLNLAGKPHDGMRQRLYQDRVHLSTYAKALTGIAMHRAGETAERDMILHNIEQLLRFDAENQTAWLELGNANPWWMWYGNETETQAAYLKLLVMSGQTADRRAPWLVKYLLNNRKHATSWGSTRDTALCVESFIEYLKATGESEPAMRVNIEFDGDARHAALVTRGTLFTQTNRVEVPRRDLDSGRHRLDIQKDTVGAGRATGPLYYSAYLRYFSRARTIRAAGSEIRVDRCLYRLVRRAAAQAVPGTAGQVVSAEVEKYDRVPLANEATVRSGDLIEVELTLTSKNDYEQLVVEDPRVAGMEPVDVRSGYNSNALGAYVEYRDTATLFYVRRLARGSHSVSYRLRAEAPGEYRALPAQARGMYAPELRANSEGIRLTIEEREP